MGVIWKIGVLALSLSWLAGCIPYAPLAPEEMTRPPAVSDVTAKAPLDATPPVWKVGERWEYSDGYGIEVGAVENGLTTFKRLDRSGDWIQRWGLFRVASLTGKNHRAEVYRTRSPEEDLFPLAVGKKSEYDREYLSNGKELKVHHSVWKVTGRETIVVPAGKFDCWILENEDISLKSDWVGFERWFYSPQARNFVRLEYQYGNTPRGSRVLMRYHLEP